jgi:hypothetical protein
VNYRKLKKIFHESGTGKVIMPLIPFDPTGDTLPPRSRPLVEREGVYHESGSRKPYFGLAARYHDVDKAQIHLRYTCATANSTAPWTAGAPTGEIRFTPPNISTANS